jgi:hypothetical protein
MIIFSCQKQIKGEGAVAPGAPSPIELRFAHKVTPFNDLVLDSSYSLGLSFFTVTDFKYYISNMEFVNSDGDTIKIPETYFLIEHRKPASQKPQFTIPAGDYYGMSFLIGVDSARNVSGAQTGALDPSLGMFWNRTDGYIMARLEGTCTASTLPGNTFSYHVGGYKAPYNVLSRRHFKLGGNISVSPGRKTVINFTTDVKTWFSSPNTINIAANPTCSSPGDLAYKISQNYYKMFDFISVKYE